MRVPSQPQAIRQISERLAELVDPDCQALRLKESLQVDAALRAGRFVFVVEWKSVGSAASTYSVIRDVRQHTEEIKRAGEADGEVVPLVAVPFMGKFGRERCAEYGVSWLDLSGNAQISAPGLRILVEGKPNQYKRTGRPSTAFAPRSSRICAMVAHAPDQTDLPSASSPGRPARTRATQAGWFLLTAGGRRVWTEAVSATTGQNGFPDSVPEPEYGKLVDTPIDKYVLRIRNSLDEKARKFRTYIENGTVDRNDVLVIAINVWGVGLGPHLYHCMQRALYGEGDLILNFDKRTGEVVGSGYERTPDIHKQSGAQVGLTRGGWPSSLIDGSMSHISAAMASSATAVEPPLGLGDDCVLYPNLSCVNPWPKGTMPMGEERIVQQSEDGEGQWILTKIAHTLRRKEASSRSSD